MDVGESRAIPYERRAIFPGYYPPTLRRITCLYFLNNWGSLYDWSELMYEWCEQSDSWFVTVTEV